MFETATVFWIQDDKLRGRAFATLERAELYARKTRLTGSIMHRQNSEHTYYQYRDGERGIVSKSLEAEKSHLAAATAKVAII